MTKRSADPSTQGKRTHFFFSSGDTSGAGFALAATFAAWRGIAIGGVLSLAVAAMVGKESNMVISPSGTTESASNPEIVISNCYLESYTPINSTVGELAMLELTFTGGTWTRDITP